MGEKVRVIEWQEIGEVTRPVEDSTTWGQTMAEIRAVEKDRRFEICDALHPKFEQGCELIAGHRGDHEATITLNARWSD